MRVFLIATIVFSSILHAEEIQWRKWSNEVFEQAKRENRFVLLDLQAVWCHWCHVMEETTYKDPKVIALINKKYIAVQVDQDSRPDLANRYEDYGWPATIFYGPDGKEIVKKSGYIEPQRMASILQGVIDDPTPLDQDSQKPELSGSILSPKTQKILKKQIRDSYDSKLGGWDAPHKYLDSTFMEYELNLSQHGDAKATKMAKQTLDGELAILDPVWGGAYQYSAEGNWHTPHFEKIISVQADVMGSYSDAYMLFKDAKYLEAAKMIEAYVANYLTSPENTFFVSQDADLKPGEHAGDFFKLNDSERKKRGAPRVDTHVYARENGWMISALTNLYAATGDLSYLKKAQRAADWIIKNQKLPDGIFTHGLSKDTTENLFLGDTLSMAKACLNLFSATGEKQYLDQALQSTHSIAAKFMTNEGFVTSVSKQKSPFPSAPQGDENLQLARFANLLFAYSGEAENKTIANQALKFLNTPKQLGKTYLSSGFLLAGEEFSAEPLHVTVIGQKDDAKARELLLAAVQFPGHYKRVDWWDRREGPLRNASTSYPKLDRAAAFACSKNRCSVPAYTPEDVVKRIANLQKSGH